MIIRKNQYYLFEKNLSFNIIKKSDLNNRDIVTFHFDNTYS